MNLPNERRPEAMAQESFDSRLGNQLADSIYASLNPKSLSHSRLRQSPELTDFFDKAAVLRTMEVSDNILAQAILELVAMTSRADRDGQIAYHLRRLKDQQEVLILTDDDPVRQTQWVSVAGRAQAFADTFSQVEVETSIVERIQPDSEAVLTDEMKDVIAAQLSDDVLPPVEEIKNLANEIRSLRTHTAALTLASLIAEVFLLTPLSRRMTNWQDYRRRASGLQETRNNETFLRLARKTRRLNQIIDELLADPAFYLASAYIDQRADEIKTAAIAKVDAQVAAINGNVYSTSKSIKKIRNGSSHRALNRKSL